MIDIPFRIIDLIMKFMGAYSQHPLKSEYLEDIKYIIHPYPSVKQVLNSIYYLKNADRMISWQTLQEMMWGRNLGGSAGRNFMVELDVRPSESNS